MWHDQYIIVGDLFKEFASRNELVLTRSSFYSKLENERISLEQIELWAGQGVCVSELERMIVSTDNSLDAFTIHSTQALPKAMCERTHKHRSQNVLVSTAIQVSEKEFELQLNLDEANEFLADHMSGQHVQGMALVEASRQAFLSVTEQFYLNVTEKKFYFVINRLDIQYKAFLFPLMTQLRYRIVKQSIKENRLDFSVEIDLVQNHRVCAVSSIAFSAFEYEAISTKERRDAAGAVNDFLRHKGFSKKLDSVA